MELEAGWKALLCAGAVVVALPAAPANADFRVRSPSEMDLDEIEVETNGSATFDHSPDKGGETSYTAELGTGVTPWWKIEAELDFGRDPGAGLPTSFQGAAWENTFELTQPGEYWADLGIFAEYGVSSLRTSPDALLFGPLIQKDIGRTTHTLNLFVERQTGPDQDLHGFDLSYAWQSRWNVSRFFSPAVEVYGDAGRIDNPLGFRHEQLIAGPVGIGSLYFGTLGHLKYELGYLFGATDASPSGTLRWRLELEIPL